MYKRIKNYIHEKDLRFCYLSDGQIVTPNDCDDIIDNFECDYPDYETKYPEWSLHEDEETTESGEGNEVVTFN